MKDVLLHDAPVVIMALGSVIGLSAEESNAVAQGITAAIGLVFTIMSIWHHRHVKNKLTVK